MKKLLLLLTLSIPCFPQTTINLLNLLARCPTTTPAFLLWTGTSIQCIPFPSNVTLTGNVLSISGITTPPAFNIETNALSALVSQINSSGVLSYTLQKTPLGSFVLVYYYSQSVGSTISLPVLVSGTSLTFTLPNGYLTSDILTIAYRTQ